MPKLLHRVPAYRSHKASGQAVVTICGRDHYLGLWRSKASRIEYDRVIGEWLAAGRPDEPPGDSSPLTVVELLSRYWAHAKSYYTKNGEPTKTVDYIRVALRALRQQYGHTPAAEFGPLALKALRQKLVDVGHSRSYINKQVDVLRGVFKWAVAEQLLAPDVYQALAAVPGLRKGRSQARETEPVRPVDDVAVETTLPFLPAVVADMVRFQRLTGARPNEVCMLRPCDVDTTGEVWRYVPASHKTEHHGHSRVIFVGPKAQEVLRAYLSRAADVHCFSPSDSIKQALAARHAARKTPLKYGNRPGSNRKARPKRSPAQKYSTGAYRRAISRAVAKANEARKKSANPGAKVDLLENWSPNRLRHTAATEIR